MKLHKKNLKNKGTSGSNFRAVISTRKANRKAAREQKKANKAVHYAKAKSKGSIRFNELDKIDTKNIHNVSSQCNQNQLSNGVPNFKKKDQNNNKKKNNKPSSSKDMKANENKDSFKKSLSSNLKCTEPPKLVNTVPEELDTRNSELKKHKMKNKAHIDRNVKLINDKNKLENLRAEQENDTLEINKLARNLQLTSRQKKKGSYIDVDFRDIINDIESGIFSDANKYGHDDNDNIDNFEKDMQFAIGKDYQKNGKHESDVSESEDDDDNDGDSDDICSGSDNEEGTCSNSEDDCSNLNGFIDAEAEEDDCDDESDSGLPDDDDEEITFESGSMLPSSSNSLKLSATPPINNFFDLYSSDSENDDVDLEDFVVDDDFVEFESDDEDGKDPVTVKMKKDKKRSRIIGRKSKRLDDSEDKSEHPVNGHVVSKRRRITSEESESDFNATDNDIKIVPDNHIKDFEGTETETIVTNGINSSYESNVDHDDNYSQNQYKIPNVNSLTNASSLCVSNKNFDDFKEGVQDTVQNPPKTTKKSKSKSKKRKNIGDEGNILNINIPLQQNEEMEPSISNSIEEKSLKIKINSNDNNIVNGQGQTDSPTEIAGTKSKKNKLKAKKKKNQSNKVSLANSNVPQNLESEADTLDLSCDGMNLNGLQMEIEPSSKNSKEEKSMKIKNNNNIVNAQGQTDSLTEIAGTKSKKRKLDAEKENHSNEVNPINSNVPQNVVLAPVADALNLSCEGVNLNGEPENGVKIQHKNQSTDNVGNKSKGKKCRGTMKKGKSKKANTVNGKTVNGVQLPKSILKRDDSLTKISSHDDLTSSSKRNADKKQVSFSIPVCDTEKKLKHKTSDDEVLCEDDSNNDEVEFDDNGDFHEDKSDDNEVLHKENVEDLHEDIYGRLRDSAGRIVNNETNNSKLGTKYAPPALRKLMELNNDEKKQQQMATLQRQLKGLLNRLTESNVAGIVSQVERLYQTHSKNDMNESLVKIIFEMLVTPVLAPERLVQEQALFIAILSANVGPEVGAQILTEFVVKWDEDLDTFEPTAIASGVDSKELDNMLLFICHLYNFKVMNSTVLYDMMNKLQQRQLGPKEVDLILLILKNVGFTLRKDDPMALKNFISELQSKASTEQETNQQQDQSYTRVRFMLEVLVAIRNNNMSKVPNYDPTHIQHLKTLMKGLIRKGCRTSELSVSLQDLVKSKTQGKWWIVGSAWSRELKENSNDDEKTVSNQEKRTSSVPKKYSDEFYKKASKLRMSRPPRINILYAITEAAENYIDAYQKLTELKLPPKQEQEIFSVMTYCCIRCKEYTDFYAYLALKLCEFKKEYQRLLQFSIWDKFRQLDEMKPNQLANLAKFIVHLVAENGLNLSVFKILNFAEANEKTVSLLRQALIGILLYPAGTFVVNRAFSYLCKSPKWSLLKQYIRVFILKFVNPSKCNQDKETRLLASRVQMVLEMLTDAGVSL